MRVRLLLAAICAVASVLACAACPVAAQPVPKNNTFQGHGWTLSFTVRQMSYGSTSQGTLTHNGTRFRILGDWIPAGDAGGDLLRVYGKAFGSVRGLVSLDTFYSTCNPDCASARTFRLTPISPWTLPGTQTKRPVILTYRG